MYADFGVEMADLSASYMRSFSKVFEMMDKGRGETCDHSLSYSLEDHSQKVNFKIDRFDIYAYFCVF